MNKTNIESEACSTLDMVGAVASVLCAIHCLAMPILLATLPALGLGFLLSQDLERGFVIFAVAFAIINTCWGFRIHRKFLVIGLAVFGGAILLYATFTHNHDHCVPAAHQHSEACATHGHAGHDQHIEETRPQSSWQGLSLLICGAAFLTAAHFLNRRFCKTCHKCDHHKSSH